LQTQYLRRPSSVSQSSTPGQPLTLLPETEERFNMVLTQPLYTGGRATAAYRIAKRGVEGERQDLISTREQLLFDVGQGYYTALKARKNIEIEEAEVTRLEAHRRDSEKRFQVGEVTKTVLLRAEAELSGARANLIRAKNDFGIAKEQLRLLTKRSADFDLEEPQPLDIPPEGEAGLVRLAIERRPDLARGRVNLEIAQQGVRSSRGAFLPSLSLQGQYNWTHQSPETSFLIENDRSALVRLDFPIFEGGTRIAELSQARSRVREAEFNIALLSDQITLQLRTDLSNLASIASVIENLRDRLAFARDNFNMVSRQFAVGLATNIDVLDANATLNDAERQLANAGYDREIAILRIYLDAGVFAEKTLGDSTND
jgi:outer membrane protein